MRKKTQRIYAGVLAVIVSIAMVGAGIFGLFFNRDQLSAGSNASTAAFNAAAEYQDQKQRIEAMAQQAKIDPENIFLQKALGKEYFNAGITAQAVAPAEAQGNFERAVEILQNVIKTEKDENIMLVLASAAYLSANHELAENSYKELLEIKPDSLHGIINYGIFLSQAKQDWAGALNQWQRALTLAQDDSDKQQIQAMITQAQGELEAKAENGASNPKASE